MPKYDVVNFTNIDEEDFVGKWGGEEYLIKAGETKAFPAFLVEHFTKHLIDKILLRKGVDDYNDPVLRKPLEKQIKGEIVLKAEKEEKKTEGEKVKEEVEEISQEFAELEEKVKKTSKKAKTTKTNKKE